MHEKFCEHLRNSLVAQGLLTPASSDVDAKYEAQRIEWLKKRRAELVQKGIITPRRK